MKNSLTLILSIFILTNLHAQELKAFMEGYDADNPEAVVTFGYQNEKGEVVLKPIYQMAYDFSEGLGSVALKDKMGYIDKTGKVIIPLTYESASPFSEGLGAVGLKNKMGYIDKTGKVVIPLTYESAGTFSDGLASVVIADKWGFIDKTNKLVVPCIYDETGRMENGYGSIYLDKKWGLVDKTGRVVIQPEFDSPLTFSEGLAEAKQNEKSGYVNVTGKWIIPAIYLEGLPFVDGKAMVKEDEGHIYYINKAGNKVDGKTGKEIEIVNDINGHRYETIVVGNQTWLSKNINTDKFANGDIITEAKSVKEWEEAGASGKPAWCNYAFIKANDADGGKFYNWFAVNDKRGLAPKGWHIPSDTEWKSTLDFLGGSAVAGDKMKIYDAAMDLYASNSSGFSAFPSGIILSDNVFYGMGETADFWTATTKADNPTRAFIKELVYVVTSTKNKPRPGVNELDADKRSGMSVRCIKD